MRVAIGILLAVLLFAEIAAAQNQASKFEAGAFFSGTFLRDIGSSDHGIGTSALGIGGRVAYRVMPLLDLESELSVWPNNPATSGTWVQGFAGIKAGPRLKKFGVFAKVRPGIMYFRKDPFGATAPGSAPFHTRWASSAEAALDLGGVLEYYTARNLIVRFDLGDTVLRYGNRSVAVSQLLPPVERGGFIAHNRQGSFGVGFHF